MKKIMLLIFLIGFVTLTSFSQKAKIIKRTEYNYLVLLKNANGDITDSLDCSPERPVIKNGIYYCLSINPRSRFNRGYSFTIRRREIIDNKIIRKPTNYYGFRINRDLDTTSQNCNIDPYLIYSFDVKMRRNHLVFKYGGNKSKRHKLKFKIDDNVLETIGKTICNDICKNFDAKEIASYVID